jgi:FlaA1/EpsC-like NDP-sugar epimerase
LGTWTVATAVKFRRPLIVAAHIGLFAASYALAFGLRFDFNLAPEYSRTLLVTLPVIVALRAAAFWAFHLYEGLWRYVSVRDVVELLKAVTAASLAFGAGVMVSGLAGFPRSVLILDWIVCIGLTGGLRIVSRLVLERRHSDGAERKKAIVVGAGDVAEALLREIGRGALPYRVVGLVTSDPRMHRRRLHGVGVIGGLDDLARLCSDRDVSEVLLADDNGDSAQRRTIADRCREARVTLRSVPPLVDLLQGRAGIGQLKAVSDTELLGRSRIGTDLELLRERIAGRRVLVTGAAGSIGSELARQIASFEPERLVLLDRAESDLYLSYTELAERHPTLKIEAAVGDILDEGRVRQVMTDCAPELVYHAAAYKHVPLMEAHPIEAIKNNILGTETVARAAVEAGACEFVLISTDKAVRPVGIMGMTKRASELVVRSLAGQGTTFVAVRFGNVLGSNGSVLPLFQRQISSGSPVTVTDPEALRYFMLTSEAVELVLQAGALGSDGEVYVLHTGEPMRIGSLAENFIRLSGLEPELDVPIEVTGLRPGERLREELVVDDEDVAPGPHPKILVVREPNFASSEFRQNLEKLKCLAGEDRREASVQLLRSIVVTPATTKERAAARPHRGSDRDGAIQDSDANFSASS